MKHRRGPRILMSGGISAFVVMVLITAVTALADTATPSLVSGNHSDPHVEWCYDNIANQTGLCMFTSQDIGVAASTYNGNPYPMTKTYGYFLPSGSDPSVQ